MGTTELAEDDRAEWVEARDSKDWDEFATRNGGSIFHSWAWKEVLESDGLRTLYLACRDSRGETLGICPLVFHERRYLKYLESLPDSPIGVLVFGPRTVNQSRIIATLPKSVKPSRFKPVAAMLIDTHQKTLIDLMLSLGFQHFLRSGLYMLDLNQNEPERIWNKGFKKHDRQAVKYYEQRATFGFASDEAGYLSLERPNTNYTKGRLYRPGFVRKMRERLGDRLKVAVAADANGIAMAGVMMLLDPPDTPNPGAHLLAVRYTPNRNLSRSLSQNSAITFVNWRAINWAHERGYRYVEFGRYSLKKSLDPEHPFHGLIEKFLIEVLPGYRFTLPVSRLTYLVTKKISETFLE